MDSHMLGQLASVNTSANKLPDHLRVLVVEDHPETLNLLRMLLVRAGYGVASAKNVHDAMDILAYEQIDLLISDIGLPDGSGRDVAMAFRAGSKGPAIALSGFGSEDDVK